MNITVLANRDLPSNFALNLLLPELRRRGHEVHVFLSSHVGSKSGLPQELVDLAFFEQSLFNDLLFPALETGDADVDGADEGRAETTAPNADGGRLLTFRRFSEWIGRPVEVLNRINRPKSLERFRASAPDLVLSIRYGSILRDAAIAVPPRGVLNLHSGLLPAYRGVMATFRAMLQGEKEIGTTLHTIDDAGIDTGRILGTTRRAVDPERSYVWNVLQLYPDGVRLMLDAVDRLEADETLQTDAQEGPGAYFSFPNAEDMRAFRDAGLRLYDVAEIVEFGRRYLPPPAVELNS